MLDLRRRDRARQPVPYHEARRVAVGQNDQPLFISAFRRADELAVAMECRCYHGGEGRTRLRQLKYTAMDKAVIALFLAITVGIGVLGHFGL